MDRHTHTYLKMESVKKMTTIMQYIIIQNNKQYIVIINIYDNKNKNGNKWRKMIRK